MVSTKFKDLLIELMKDFNNQTCWRCGKQFNHEFDELCIKCEREIHGKKNSKDKNKS